MSRSQTKYEIIPATLDHCLEMFPHMRQADIDELDAIGVQPKPALMNSLRCSMLAWTGLADGEIVCIFGVSSSNLLAGVGQPWLMGTDLIVKHSREFIRRSRPCVRKMLEIYSHLENYVDVRNEKAIAWLKYIGFSFDDPQPFGFKGLPFMRFEMRA